MTDRAHSRSSNAITRGIENAIREIASRKSQQRNTWRGAAAVHGAGWGLTPWAVEGEPVAFLATMVVAVAGTIACRTDPESEPTTVETSLITLTALAATAALAQHVTTAPAYLSLGATGAYLIWRMVQVSRA